MSTKQSDSWNEHKAELEEEQVVPEEPSAEEAEDAKELSEDLDREELESVNESIQEEQEKL